MKQLKCLSFQRIIQVISVKECLTYINITDNEMLHDASVTNSIPPVCSQNHHML